MNRRLGKLGAVLAAVLAAAVAPRPLPAQIAGVVPEPIDGLKVEDKRGTRLPLDLAFTDGDGTPVTLRDAFADGKGGRRPVVIAMVYFRCPLLCPRLQEELHKGLNGLPFTVGTEYNLLVVSFDHRDTAVDAFDHRRSGLLAYAKPETESVRAGYHVWVGSAENCRTLADSLGFPYRYLPKAGEFSHPSVVFVATPAGEVSSYLEGLEFPSNDLRLSLVAAGEGRVGSLFDRVALWCYHFDATEGKYTLVWMRIMQAGAAASVVAVGSLLGAMWMVERRRRAAGGRMGVGTRAFRKAAVDPPDPGGRAGAAVVAAGGVGSVTSGEGW